MKNSFLEWLDHKISCGTCTEEMSIGILYSDVKIPLTMNVKIVLARVLTSHLVTAQKLVGGYLSLLIL